MSDGSIPTYVFKVTPFTVGTTPRAGHDATEKGLVTKTASILETSDIPDGMTVANAATFLVDFNLTFEDNGSHQVDLLKLWPIPSIGSDGGVNVTIEMALNNDDTPQISNASTVSVLTVVQMIAVDPDLSTASSAMRTSINAAFPTGQCNTVNPSAYSAIGGWKIVSHNGATHKFRDFDFRGGNVYCSNGAIATSDYLIPGYVNSNYDETQAAYVHVNETKGRDFDTSFCWSALAADPDAPFALWPVSYRADGGTDTHSFDQPVKAAYAVVRNLTNSGSSGDNNSLSAFTCSGLNVSVDTDEGTSVVSANWAREKSEWKGEDLEAWNSAVDYLIIVEFGTPEDTSSSGEGHAGHGKSD
jgi:hypothetical protein